jgi:hypothetical protein
MPANEIRMACVHVTGLHTKENVSTSHLVKPNVYVRNHVLDQLQRGGHCILEEVDDDRVEAFS